MDKVDELAKSWSSEATIKSVLLHGIPLWKWEVYALRAGWVDGSKCRGAAIADHIKSSYHRILSRGRISQVLKEVGEAIERPLDFSPHNPLFRRAVYMLLSYVVIPKIVTSAQRYFPHENDELVYSEHVWRWSGTSTYRSGECLSGHEPVMDLSWRADWRERLVKGADGKMEKGKGPVYRNRTPVYITHPAYTIVWGSSRPIGRTPYRDATGASRYSILLFNCDGDFYEVDRFEDVGGDHSRVRLKPLTYSFPLLASLE